MDQMMVLGAYGVMKKEGRQSGIPNMIAVAGIVTAAVLFTGCNYFIDKADKMAEDTTTTRYWEYTTTTTTTTTAAMIATSRGFPWQATP